MSGAKEQAARKAFLDSIKDWPKHERRAAEAGWEYVLDMCHVDVGRYDINRMDGSGSDEAFDLADSTVTEKPWKGKKDREAAADCIYEGIVAARKFIRNDQ